jgi:hypothetical protein
MKWRADFGNGSAKPYQLKRPTPFTRSSVEAVTSHSTHLISDLPAVSSMTSTLAAFEMIGKEGLGEYSNSPRKKDRGLYVRPRGPRPQSNSMQVNQGLGITPSQFHQNSLKGSTRFSVIIIVAFPHDLTTFETSARLFPSTLSDSQRSRDVSPYHMIQRTRRTSKPSSTPKGIKSVILLLTTSNRVPQDLAQEPLFYPLRMVRPQLRNPTGDV